MALMRQNALSKGFYGGRKGWLFVGILLWAPRVAKRMFGRTEETLTLEKLAPGQTVESVQAAVGWPLRVADSLREMTPPTVEELAIVREQLDPQGLYR